jgi:hypothetical protein
MGKILFVAVPKICSRSRSHDNFTRFQTRPVVLGLARAIVAAFALVARAGHTPEKFCIHCRNLWKFAGVRILIESLLAICLALYGLSFN